MKNANGKGFDNDRRQSSSSQFKSQNKGKKDTRDGDQYCIPSGPKCFGCQDLGHMKQECPISQEHWEKQGTCCYFERHRA